MGTALKDQCLHPNYQPSEVILDLTWQQCLELPQSRFQNVKLVCGHLCYNIDEVLGYTPKKIMMIRHPFYRAMSLYKFAERVEWYHLHLHAKDRTFLEFLNDERVVPYVSNIYARHLYLDITPRQLADRMENPTREKMDDEFRSFVLPDDRELLEIATWKLDSMLFVGVADKFFESVQVLLHLLGISDPKFGPDISKQMHPFLRSNIYQIMTDEYNRLTELNYVDLSLWGRADEKLRRLYLSKVVLSDT